MSSRPATYLIVAGLPTPNGPLHLGHLGGPFLRADALARFLTTRGHRALCASASDVWNAYIVMRAEEIGTPSSVVVDFYHRSIEHTLETFGMGQVCYLKPSEGTEYTTYARHSDFLIQRLGDVGRLRVTSEDLLFDEEYRRFVVGPWLVGECPYCGEGVAGSSCERCARFFPPGAVVKARERSGHQTVSKAVRTVSAVIDPDFCPLTAAHRFPARAYPLLNVYHQLGDGWLRLSEPMTWGTPWSHPSLPEGAVHQNYGTGLYAISRLIGDKISAITDIGNAFDSPSEVTTVLSGGLEFALACVFLIDVSHLIPEFKPYDYVMFNQFLSLYGEKFSTSQNHAIWGDDYSAAGLPIEPLRWYLGMIADEQGDFSPAEFAHAVSVTLEGLVEGCVKVGLQVRRHPADEISPAARQQVDHALAEQAAAFSLPDISLSKAAQLVAMWASPRVRQYFSADEQPLWLAVMAIMAYPFMPEWASALWGASGGSGTPAVNKVLHMAQRGTRLRPGSYRPIGHVEISVLENLVDKKADHLVLPGKDS